MTIIGWVIWVLITGAAAAMAFAYFWDFKFNRYLGIAVALCVTVAVSAATFGGLHWYYTSTASGSRAVKTQHSELNNGVERVVTVYDVEGDVIQRYDGKFDVTYDDDRILFDDENGKRHVIYYSTGNVIIDEK